MAKLKIHYRHVPKGCPYSPREGVTGYSANLSWSEYVRYRERFVHLDYPDFVLVDEVAFQRIYERDPLSIPRD